MGAKTEFDQGAFWMKFVLLVILILGIVDPLFAQDNPTVSAPPAAQLSSGEAAHRRMVELRNRIQDQRRRIDRGIKSHQLNPAEAKESFDILGSVEKQMKADMRGRSSKGLTREEYDTYNNTLDANSRISHEERSRNYGGDPTGNDKP